MKWALSSLPLKPVADANLNNPQDILLQVARQDLDGNVLIDRGLLARMNFTARAAMIVHELMLSKLGLNFPRPKLRLIIRSFFERGAEGLPIIEQTLNGVSPSILAGTYEVRFELKLTPGVPRAGYRVYLGTEGREDLIDGGNEDEFGGSNQKRTFGSDFRNRRLNFRVICNLFGSDFFNSPAQLNIYVNGVLQSAESFNFEIRGAYGELRRATTLR
ncbi:hypothetical protein WDW37_13815 [Bdellovibrionota bacterium FG-1]